MAVASVGGWCSFVDSVGTFTWEKVRQLPPVVGVDTGFVYFLFE